MIDLRSDTVTKPSAAMRAAIANAEVGDDVLGDDPTIRKLETYVASLLGKEAAVFMPTGTMTNQVAIRCHTEAGDEVLCDSTAHVYNFEAGAPAAISGVMIRHLHGERGIFSAKQLANALRPNNLHYPPTKLVVVENTSNRGGGSIWPLETVREIHDLCANTRLAMHLDGARLWNACAATQIPESDYAKFFDSVSVCFSKGLGAPIGSALAGTKTFIERARRFRKMLGGGMRQAGIIAAGALFAVENNRNRLCEDHRNAQLFAQRIAQNDSIELIPEKIETNIVIFRTKTVSAEFLSNQLFINDILILPTSHDTLRAVTHLDVNEFDIIKAANTITRIIREQS